MSEFCALLVYDMLIVILGIMHTSSSYWGLTGEAKLLNLSKIHVL